MKNKYAIKLLVSCAALSLLLLCFLPPMAQANAPQDVKIAYDAGSQNLKVTITHKSSFTNTHYIKYVEITKNGNSLGKNIYDSQPDPETFSYTYNVPAVKGDTLTVKASCSVVGSKTAVLDIQ
jgi:hypothetical protein